MNRKLRSFLCVLLVSSLGLPAQTRTPAAATEKGMAESQRQGIPIQTKSNVDEHIRVQSVVVPHSVAKRVFGKEIADTHIVVQLAISNKSPDMAFVLHNAYIDFSGVANAPSPTLVGLLGSNSPNLQGRNGSATSRISSVESRVARGQLLDAQQTTARNITMRVLTTLGSVAAGYSFSFGERGIARGIAAFNGNVVPGVAYAWPDLTVAQLNRISDFGYQTNKLIPKEAGDIVVCFFPIADFLTPGFQKIFQKAPAALFTPLQMIKDKTIQKLVYDNLKLDAQTVEGIDAVLPCFQLLTAALKAPAPSKATDDAKPDPLILGAVNSIKTGILSSCQTTLASNIPALTQLLYLQNLSFDNLLVEVEGVMTVDVRQVPARISSITFEGDAANPQFWAAPGVLKARMDGEYLANGNIRILEAEKLGIKEITVDSAKATDKVLPFSITTTKPVPSGTKLTLVVDRKFDANQTTTSTVSSMNFEYVISYVLTGPIVENVKQEGSTVTLTGSRLFNIPGNELKVSLTKAAKSVDAKVKAGATDTTVAFDLPDKLDAGCWVINLRVGTMAAIPPKEMAAKLPNSKITGSKRDGDVLTVEGEDFVDTKDCGPALLFKARPATGDLLALKLKSGLEPKKAVFDIPEALKKIQWQLELWQGDKELKPSRTIPAPQ